MASTLPVSISEERNQQYSGSCNEETKLDDSTPASIITIRNEGLKLLFRLLLVQDKTLNQT